MCVVRHKTITGSFLFVQGVPGEAGASGAVGPRVSLHVKASLVILGLHKTQQAFN